MRVCVCASVMIGKYFFNSLYVGMKPTLAEKEKNQLLSKWKEQCGPKPQDDKRAVPKLSEMPQPPWSPEESK